MDYQRMFLESRNELDGVVTDVARCHGLTGETLAELRRSVVEKLKEDDFGLLRRYAGRSRLRTYFLIITERVYLDSRSLTGVGARSPDLPAPSSRMSALPPFPA
jgi:hypothetical protein